LTCGISVLPARVVVDRLGDEIRPYVVGRGTLRFPANRPLPLETIAKVVRIRLEETASSSPE